MRLKHVLFSGLLLSVGFAACTNDEITEVSAPVTTGDAISLGEGYIITGTNYVADPTTRSIYDLINGALTPAWEESDVIGAAWYSLIGEGGITADGGVANGATIEAPNLNYKFASNTDFKYLEPVGDEFNARFQANTNIMAGAYVLYFPFDEEVQTVSNAITVKREFPVDMNCEKDHEFDAINGKRTFSISEVAFLRGRQTGTFQLRPIPVIYRFRFGAEALDLVKLGGTLTIDKVIMEATANGASVLATQGTVVPPTTQPTAAQYNSYIAYTNGDEDGEPLPQAIYKSSDTEGVVGHYTINVLNSDQPAYQITELGEENATEGSIIFSALPFTKPADKITIKIVTSEGKVLRKEYNAAEDADVIKEFNDANTAAAAAEDANGELVQETVLVNSQSDDNTIYTTDQFDTQWAAAIKSDKQETLTIADPVILEDVTLACDNVDANVTIKSEDGAALTIRGINLSKGTLNIQADVTTDGDIVATGNSNLTISGKVTAKNINIDGDADLTVAEMESLTVGKSGEVVLNLPDNKEKAGSITIEEGGELTLESGALDGITNKGGVLTLTGEVTNYGEFKGSVVTGTNGKFINAKGATATFDTSTGENTVAVVNKKGATINIEMPAAYTTGWNNVFYLATGSENKGTINVKKGQLKADNLTQTDDAARIYVEKDGYVELNNSKLEKGWVVMNDANALVGKPGDTKVAFSVKKVTDLNLQPATVTNVFIDADLEITKAASVKSGNVYINKSQTLGADFTTPGNTYIAGDVTFTSSSTTEVIFAAGAKNSQANLYVPGHLTLAKGVKLTYWNMPNANDMMHIDALGEYTEQVEKLQ